MIVEGLKLTILGMGVVFAFLGLLIVVIKLNARVLRPLTDKEEVGYRTKGVRGKGTRRQQEDEEKRRIMAVIGAAIAAHRTRVAALAAQSAGNGRRSAASEQATRTVSDRVGPARHPRGRLAALLLRDRSTLQGVLRRRERRTY